MSVRRFSTALLFLTMSLIAILFNNCSGQMQSAESSATEEASETPPPAGSGKLTAKVDSVSTDGRIWGYAQDAYNKQALIKMFFYLDGPVGTGTYVGTITANVPSVGTYAGHYFSYQLPSEWMNGKPHQLYVYGISAKPENLIAPSPLAFAAYMPKAEAVFNQRVSPITSGDCMRCHAWTYRSLFYGPLMNPSPFKGGTATNNRLIRKIGGLEGHGGGNFCPGGLDSGPCAEVQAWWKAEFQ